MAQVRQEKFAPETSTVVGAAPAIARMSSGISGDNTSKQSLAHLAESLRWVKDEVALQYLIKASADLKKSKHDRAEKWALKALSVDEKSGISWHILAVCREMAGDFVSSMNCYQAALALLPHDKDIINNLGRLASRMGDHESAAKFFRLFVEMDPFNPSGLNNLSSALRNESRFDEAIDVLKEGLRLNPDSALLWNGIGAVMADIGDVENAFIFFEECLRLDPKFSRARYNRGNMRLSMGDTLGALEDCDKSLSQTKPLDEICMIRMARAGILLNIGRLSAGWEEYETRLDPNFYDCTI